MEDKETAKYYKIYGYDSNFDLGGNHSQPLLCIVRARDKAQAEEYANTLPRYKDSWCGKGYVVEVKVVNLVAEVKFLKKQIIDSARKETAEKILNKQYQECKVAERDVLIARGGNKNDDYYKGFSLGMTNTKMHIQELAEQFGVEVKEQ